MLSHVFAPHHLLLLYGVSLLLVTGALAVLAVGSAGRRRNEGDEIERIRGRLTELEKRRRSAAGRR